MTLSEPGPSRAPAGGPDADGFALFLDFDGTLVDLAPRPQDVVVAAGLGQTLERLRDRCGGALALVSGRPIAVLDEFLAPHVFDAAGLHGVETRHAGRLLAGAGADDPGLRDVAERLSAFAKRHPGLLLEDKGRSVALHWRLAPELEDEAVAQAGAAMERLGPGWRIQTGKSVLEILPAFASKAGAVRAFLDMDPFRGRRPVFVGDDVTDEHGFQAVLELGGLAIRIGDGPTIAPFRLPSPTAFRERLTRWAEGAPIEV
ncbi:trehalose 6-phosphate phosphatase [Alsobacter metallidurans]|uniref:Trehalose 6-phosphate phosphatase n=1 Tax=Alsobacter metallidurans TaxID=340221 RepID=A0A917MFM2_9HYPH|nr:trehalose-phosphatase [Alsobacter metallidurans]GGH09502.1 trehalose 6-phosphate phosphatase [Alsobacter metallidurans]